MAGRKKDNIWNFFIKKMPSGTSKARTGCRAQCKDCGFELQGLVDRMKKHQKKCPGLVPALISEKDSHDEGKSFTKFQLSFIH